MKLKKIPQPIIAIIIGLILFIINKYIDGLILSFLMFVGGVFLITYGILGLIGLSSKVFIGIIFLILAVVTILVPDPLPFIDEILFTTLSIYYLFKK